MKTVKAIAVVAFTTASAAFAAEGQTPPKPSQTTETFGAWTVRCVGDAQKNCEALQVINSQAGTLAEIAIALPSGRDEAVIAGRAPLGVSISEPMRFGEKDSAEAIEIDYVTCVSQGCLAQAKVPAAGLWSLADKKTGNLTIREHSGRVYQITVSLDGLKDALTRLGAV